jgi:hypothetical protein
MFIMSSQVLWVRTIHGESMLHTQPPTASTYMTAQAKVYKCYKVKKLLHSAPYRTTWAAKRVGLFLLYYCRTCGVWFYTGIKSWEILPYCLGGMRDLAACVTLFSTHCSPTLVVVMNMQLIIKITKLLVYKTWASHVRLPLTFFLPLNQYFCQL